MVSNQNPSSRPRLMMTHPLYPKIQIPAARVMGLGRQPALPAVKLVVGDQLVLDYGKVFSLQKQVVLAPQKIRLNMVSPDGEATHRTVTPNTHVAVSWGTFNKHWTVQKNGGKTMAKTGKKINLTGKQLDLHTPIKSGVSFTGSVDMSKQGSPGIMKKSKKLRF